MRNKWWIGLLLVLVLLLAACGGDDENDADSPDWQPGVATLVVDRGSVTYGADAQPLSAGERAEVREGDRVEVSDDGEATLTFYDGAETRLAPGTTVEVTAFQQAGESAQVELRVVFGQALSSVSRVLDADSRHDITSGSATISVRGTEYLVAARENDLVQVTTMDGEVEVVRGDQTAIVLCGYGVWMDEESGMSDLLVWGMASTPVEAPVEEVDLPVRLTNANTGQVFYYRTSDHMLNVPLGTYEMLVESPGPYRVTDIEFPEDTTPEDLKEIPVELAAVTFYLVDVTGEPVVGDMVVRLTQGDLEGVTQTTAGETLLVGPGDWGIDVWQASNPDQVQTFEATVEAGQSAALDIPINEFGGE